MCRYKLVQECRFSTELGRYYTYGLLVDQQVALEWIVVAVATDVSCDSEFVSNLAKKCTRLQLAPCHLVDVILDEIP